MISSFEKNNKGFKLQDTVPTRFVLFALNGEDYCVPVLQTLEVIAEYQITPMPTLPERFEGVLSLRGKPVPVLNLRKRFSLPAKKSDAHTRVIIVETQQSPVGIEVDQVKKVICLYNTEIGPAPTVSTTKSSDLVDGMAELAKGRFASILNVATILNGANDVSYVSPEASFQGDAENITIQPKPYPDIHSHSEING